MNGKVVTVEPGQADARAVAVAGDRIVAVGNEDEIKRYVGTGTQVIDAAGQLVIPGFVEGHGHFTGVGEAQLVLKLATAQTWDDILAMVETAAKSAKPGQWIYGRGWHQEKWKTPPSPSVEGFPTEASLSRVSPANPVMLTHASGHASFVNALAMKLSGVSRTTKNPEGGEILKDAKGNPTGLLRETASRLIKRGAGEPAPTDEERRQRDRRVLELAAKEALSKGITSFQDAGTSFETIDLMKAMADEDKLGIRLWVMVRAGLEQEAQKLAQYRMVDYANGHLTVRAIKRSIDGALGSAGAWLLEPYADKPDSTGLNTTPVEDIRATARLGHAARLSALRARDRRPRQSRDPEHLRGGVQGQSGQEGPPLARRARAASQSGRHPAIRRPRRHRLDGRRALHVGCPVRAGAPRAEARRRGRVRLAEADEIWRGRHQRHRRASRGRRSDRQLLRDCQPQAQGWKRLLSGPAHEPHGGAEVLHASTARSRRSKRAHGDRSRPGSTPTWSCSRRTS